MKKLTDEELAFIEEQLSYQDDLEFVAEKNNDTGGNIKVTSLPPVSNSKKSKVPAYRNPMHWTVALIMAPILLSGVLMFLIMRVEAMFGADSLNWLANDSTGQSVKQIAQEMGFTWLAPVVEIYKERWLIVGLLFTVFFILAAMVIVYDNFLSTKLKNRRIEKNKTKIKQKQDKKKETNQSKSDSNNEEEVGENTDEQ